MGFDLATQVPVIFLGVLVGAFAFALLALALWPVVARKADANMAKGMLGVCVSFVILVLGVVVVRLLARDALVPFAAGELVGFFAGWIAIALLVMARTE